MMLESVLPLSEVENQFEKLERLLEMHEDGQPCTPCLKLPLPRLCWKKKKPGLPLIRSQEFPQLAPGLSPLPAAED